jgi:tripartite motif-containing protein 71
MGHTWYWQFDGPEGGAVASDGSVYVADESNHRIQKFTSEGVFVIKWGTNGTGDGQFQGQHGIFVAPDGSVYVSEVINHRIQKFSVG